MADDIDDLLDEVESKFCKTNSSKSRSKVESSKNSGTDPLTNSKGKSGRRDELSDMIRDICIDDSPNPDDIFEVPSSSTKVKGKPSLTSKSSFRKCLTLQIGGTACPEGLNTGMSKRCCHKLRCTSCDFQVVIFDDYEWHKDCDYLFFRNNVPDFSRLKSKLIPKKGSRAYACQCTWRSTQGLIEVQSDSGLKWVCGNHS